MSCCETFAENVSSQTSGVTKNLISGACDALVEEAFSAGSVFVHCANGHGRSAAFAAALLLRRGLARDVAEAMGIIRRARPACRLNPVQTALAGRYAPAP